jgi:Na+-translocating ferredoxin:NAD+ oxidoreductase subunit G
MIKENKKQNSIFAITLNLTIASLIAGIIIAGVYFITEPFAVKQRLKFRDDSMKALVKDASFFKPVKDKAEWFTAEDTNGVIAYILPAHGHGYGGEIKIIAAVAPDEKIIDYKILSHNETPGLGDQTDLPKFKKQFYGKQAENLEVVRIHEDGKIDAITGATITSTAVTKAIKASLLELHDYLNLKKEAD